MAASRPTLDHYDLWTQPQLTDDNHCVFKILTQRSPYCCKYWYQSVFRPSMLLLWIDAYCSITVLSRIALYSFNIHSPKTKLPVYSPKFNNSNGNISVFVTLLSLKDLYLYLIMKDHVSVCVCVRFISFIIPLERGLDEGFKLCIQIDQADFTYWISFLPSNLVVDISCNPKALGTNT